MTEEWEKRVQACLDIEESFENDDELRRELSANPSARQEAEALRRVDRTLRQIGQLVSVDSDWKSMAEAVASRRDEPLADLDVLAPPFPQEEGASAADEFENFPASSKGWLSAPVWSLFAVAAVVTMGVVAGYAFTQEDGALQAYAPQVNSPSPAVTAAPAAMSGDALVAFLSAELGGEEITDSEGLEWFSELEGLENVSGLSLSSSEQPFFVLSFGEAEQAVRAQARVDSTQPEFRAESAGRQLLVGSAIGEAEGSGVRSAVWQLFLSAESPAEP